MDGKKMSADAMDSLSNKVLGLFQKPMQQITASDIKDMLLTPLMKMIEDKDMETDAKEETKETETEATPAVSPQGGSNPFSDYKNMM